MDTARKVSYWDDIAEYDLATARAMVSTGRWLYAAFMSQQALEKALKAAFLRLGRGDEPPRTHNLTFLLEQLGLGEVPDTIASLAAHLSAYYIEARYPSYRAKLSSLVDENEGIDLVRRTTEAMAWVSSLHG